MKIFVSVILFLSCISTVGASVFFLRLFIFKIMYYHPSKRQDISDKYDFDATIGNIRTDQFDYLKSDSINVD